MDPAEEVELYEETINEEKGELEKGIVALRTVSAAERREHIRRLDMASKKLRKALIGYRTQIRGLKDPVKRATYERKVKEHLQDLDNWDRELKESKADPGEPGNPLDPTSVVIEEKGTRQSVLKDALKVQDQSLASLARTAQVAAQSEDLAVKTNVQLKVQTEQLGRIDNDLDTLQGEIKRARKEMVWFVRNAMTDKCLVCLFGLIALAVVFLICWKIWGSSLKKTTSTSHSPSPSPRP
eukprot:GGOE01006745.1.p1 GENE.GGOE01006745.1~~GGOE01006745.1.p1  ORF type:complete len:239 (-),score=88.58 GGOE01006745.1:768-1484(-)